MDYGPDQHLCWSGPLSFPDTEAQDPPLLHEVLHHASARHPVPGHPEQRFHVPVRGDDLHAEDLIHHGRSGLDHGPQLVPVDPLSRGRIGVADGAGNLRYDFDA